MAHRGLACALTVGVALASACQTQDTRVVDDGGAYDALVSDEARLVDAQSDDLASQIDAGDASNAIVDNDAKARDRGDYADVAMNDGGADATSDASSTPAADARAEFDAEPNAGVDASRDARIEDAVDGSTFVVDAGQGPPDASIFVPPDVLDALFVAKFDPSDRDYRAMRTHAVAYKCLAAISAYRRGLNTVDFGPSYMADLNTVVVSASDYLMSIARQDGWTKDNEASDAFQDGTMNSSNTVYAFQTGLVSWCLAQAASLETDRARADALYDVSSRAVRGFVDHAFIGRTSTAHLGLCTGCGYFWYSRNANDAGRFVKNTNVEMGMAALALDRARPALELRTAGLSAIEAQRFEVRENNYGYLGIDDRNYQVGRQWWDPHNFFEAYVLLHAGELTRNLSTVCRAHRHYHAIDGHGAPRDVAKAACHFARRCNAARRACTDFLSGSQSARNDSTLMGLEMNEWPELVGSLESLCPSN